MEQSPKQILVDFFLFAIEGKALNTASFYRCVDHLHSVVQLTVSNNRHRARHAMGRGEFPNFTNGVLVARDDLYIR